MHTFIAQYDIISDHSAWNESTLKRVDNVPHGGFEPIGDSSSNNFVGDVAKANRAKVLYRDGFL